MERINSRFVIGTHIMFYEHEVFKELTQSLINAISTVDPRDRDKITIDFMFNFRETFEALDRNKVESFYDLFNIDEIPKTFKSLGVRIETRIESDTAYNNHKPYTMTDYRRWLNDYYCEYTDYVIWGETDCLAPKEIFHVLDGLRTEANKQGIHRYITTFATRKMWDDSWKVLEHPEFTNCKYYERHDPESKKQPSSIHYTMTLEEMYGINDKQEEVKLEVINYPKFDGSFLCITSELIKAGANIPKGFFGLSAEDTAFMYSCMNVMKDSYVQFVVKNILKVHNREHPAKRQNATIANEACNCPSTQASKGRWYDIIRQINKLNLDIYVNKRQDKFLTWDDYFEMLEKLNNYE